MGSDPVEQLSPECLIEVFGSRSPMARSAVPAFYELLDESEKPVAGDEHTSVATLARRFGLAEERPSADRLRIAMETYYSAVVRLVVERVLGNVEALGDVDDLCGVRARSVFKKIVEDSNVAAQLRPWQSALLDKGSLAAVDWFGPLYQDLFPRSLRHALGEYYTPPWLAEHVLDTVGYLVPENDEHWRDASGTLCPASRLLDPTCGSGVFLLAAIRRIRAAAGRNVSREELCRRIFDNVAGFDVNRLAVLTARANFLLAVGDLPVDALPSPALPIQLRDVVLDEESPGESFDYVVGNPPWIAWDNLDEDYRERTKPLWQQYGLFSLSGTQARHGGGKKDLSMLVLYHAADRYLQRGGRLGFVITQTLFQTKGAGDGFRRFRLGEQGKPLSVLRVDDLSAVRPFAGASNWTATVALEKGCETNYPVRYVRWRECKVKRADSKGATGVSPVFQQHGQDARGTLEVKSNVGVASSSIPQFDRVECLARPIDLARPRSPWLVLPKGLKRDLGELIGPSDYTANLGANSGGANGVYWVEVVGEADRKEHDHASVAMAPDAGQPDVVTVRNLSSVGKRSVEPVEACVESELLYPLVRWGDLRRWQAIPRAWLLLAQDVETRSGIERAVMQERWPEALAYLERFRDLLERRAAYRRYQSAGPFWSMYNVGPYTVAPIKVVWRRMDRRINAAVVEPIDDPRLGRRPVVVQETCVQVAVESADEAHYLAAVLNSSVVNYLAAAHSVHGGKGFGTPSMLDYLNVRHFRPDNARHRQLSELSRRAHHAAIEQCETAKIQKEIDQIAGQLWGLSCEEVSAIKGYMYSSRSA